ncbi:hypothetical protein [Hymenobacter sp. DG01]|uniref:hypothetical protein n=1 Tax=Hymenobacter sp. DG01 TaxID=2584940 RepID=UPI002150BFFB|nr:hypothetical protein [Hymenobacter sp. DG01]
MEQSSTPPVVHPIHQPQYVQVPMYAQVAPPVSTGDWIGTSLLMMIPVVNFVLLLVWAFSSGTNPSKANWAKANLIFMLVFSVLGLFFFLTVGAALMNVR